MNPLYWKREHQIAFLAATAVCAGIGIFLGIDKWNHPQTFIGSRSTYGVW